MSTAMCVVFADAFAYRTYKLLGGLGEGYHLQKIIPGIGYSSNLHYLLFDGKKPDDVGFFTDYTWKPASARKVGYVKKTCDDVETANNIYRYVSRKITKDNSNIPFSERDYFFQNGRYKFMTEHPTSVFGRSVDMAYEGNDYIACFDKAESLLNSGSKEVVVVLEELDHTGHAVGSLGEKYIDSAKEILVRTTQLFNEFKQRYPDCLCILISDHGMSDVMCGVNVMDSLKKEFGHPGSKYQVYTDSVYLRLWSDDEKLLAKISTFLNKIDLLVMLKDEERKRYGVLNRGCGDKIFRLREGYVFQPNCFGLSIRGGVKGIHGFMEASDSASGILVINQQISNEQEIDAYEVFDRVSSIVG